MSKLLQRVDRGGVVEFGPRGEARYRIVKVEKKKVDRSKAFGAWKLSAEERRNLDKAFSQETDDELASLLLMEDPADPDAPEYIYREWP